VMTDLANGLDEVCILSKRHFKKCEADRQLKGVQHKAQREAVLDAAASNRWTDDVHMQAEADDLATFFDDRQRSVSRWLGSRRGTDGASMSSMSLPEVDVGDGYRHCYDACQLVAACKATQSATATIALRRYAASMVDALATQTQRTYVFNNGQTLSYPLLSDFEAWRTEQADRRRSVALSVGSFSSTSPT
jgi:hypothetical protein